MEKQRDLYKLADDGLWPWFNLDKGLDTRRGDALHLVLTIMPEEHYQIIKSKIEDFQWYLPHEDMGGEIFPTFSKCVLYLSPLLEKKAKDISVAVVAHELAHLTLGHKLLTSSEADKKQEKEADQRVCEWGFEKMLKKIRATPKRAKTREKNIMKTAGRKRGRR